MRTEEVRDRVLNAIADVISHKANDNVRARYGITRADPTFMDKRRIAVNEEVTKLRIKLLDFLEG